MTPNQFTYRVWTASRTLPHGQRPTKKHVRVARALARHPSAMPSHRQLARAAECCVRTVQNALGRFRLELGLIDWRHVFDRRMRPSDRRRQRPSIYFFPDAPILNLSCLYWPANFGNRYKCPRRHRAGWRWRPAWLRLLHRMPAGKPQFVPWAGIYDQFGHGYRSPERDCEQSVFHPRLRLDLGAGSPPPH